MSRTSDPQTARASIQADIARGSLYTVDSGRFEVDKNMAPKKDNGGCCC